MKNACFIIPYFGKLPNTFPIYLRTCAENPDFDWLIVTDDHTDYDYPLNVHCSYTTFDDFAAKVQSHFDFPIALKFPYKICDFRAAFGVIFADELKEFRFWGHCDLDQYFGKIGHFITDEILDSYDKILCLGHFTLFRNVPRINNLYLIPDRTRNESYRDCFSDSRHRIFDEWPTDGHTCINRIAKQEGVNTYYCHDCFCDLKPFASRYQRYIFDADREDWAVEPISNMVYLWEKGNLFACHKEGGKVIRREMLYVHIRQRRLDISRYDASKDAFYIVPNAILSSDRSENMTVRKLLGKAWRRSLLHPDEIARQTVLLKGYWRAAKRRLKRREG